ncbi:MAG: hypothetical protein JW841_10015 [Deltaproteobacteria bacterium]|nr:hypothetical protein [Deltaproteobacteria bacterium]
MTSDKKPSLKDFDYFSINARPAKSSELLEHEQLPENIEAEIKSWQKERRRAGFSAITSTIVVAVCTWFLWGYRDAIAYSFSSSHPPLVLGDVVELSPSDIPHNSFVELTGITEHRGLSQKTTQGLWLLREERWNFRFVGSRGVFISTPPDSSRFGFAMRITVRGRAIDPKRDSKYAQFISEYKERFFARMQDTSRVIEVDVVPGSGRWPFILFAIFIAIIVTLDSRSLLRYLRSRRRHVGIMR